MPIETKDIGFQDKLNAAVLLVDKFKKLVIKTSDQMLAAKADLETIRRYEKELDEEYRSHPVIIEAKRLQEIKGDIACLLENARKDLKNGPMLRYEQEQDEKLRAEEKRIADEMRKENEARAARIAKELEKEAAEAKKRGDAEAARKAKEEAAQVKADAATTVIPTVVLPNNTPKETRRKVTKWRMKDATKVNRDFLAPDEVLIGKTVRAMGKMAETVVGGIETWEELV